MKTLGKVKVHQVFNASMISGPETLVMPNLSEYADTVEFVLIQEKRAEEKAKKVAEYVTGLGFKIHEFWVDSQLDLKSIRAMSRFWRETQPDIIHAHAQKASFYTGLAVKWPGCKIHSKTMTTNHSVRLNQFSKKLRFYETVYQKLVMPLFDQTIVVCSSDVAMLQQSGVAPEKIRVHLNGVDRPKLTWSERQAITPGIRKSWGLTDHEVEGTVLGVVARLALEKRHDRILGGLAKALQKRPDLNMTLVCMGLGPLEQELKGLTERLSLSDRVKWLGYRPGASKEIAALSGLLSWSDSEGLPINLIESGWVATPVLAHAVDGVPELVTEETGMLMKPLMTEEMGADVLIRFADDKVLQERLGKAFQERVETKFSKTMWNARLDELYSEILSE